MEKKLRQKEISFIFFFKKILIVLCFSLNLVMNESKFHVTSSYIVYLVFRLCWHFHELVECSPKPWTVVSPLLSFRPSTLHRHQPHCLGKLFVVVLATPLWLLWFADGPWLPCTCCMRNPATDTYVCALSKTTPCRVCDSGRISVCGDSADHWRTIHRYRPWCRQCRWKCFGWTHSFFVICIFSDVMDSWRNILNPISKRFLFVGCTNNITTFYF